MISLSLTGAALRPIHTANTTVLSRLVASSVWIRIKPQSVAIETVPLMFIEIFSQPLWLLKVKLGTSNPAKCKLWSINIRCTVSVKNEGRIQTLRQQKLGARATVAVHIYWEKWWSLNILRKGDLPFTPVLPPLPSLRSRPPYIQLEGLGELWKLPQRGLKRSPSRNRIRCILASKYDNWWQQF